MRLFFFENLRHLVSVVHFPHEHENTSLKDISRLVLPEFVKLRTKEVASRWLMSLLPR